MRNQLTLTNLPAEPHEFKLFGAAVLPPNTTWPIDDGGKAMLLFLSFPLNIIGRFSSLASTLICNVFLTYDPVEMSHLYNERLSETWPRATDGSRFIVCDIAGGKTQKRRVIDVPKKLENEFEPEKDPYWLQDEVSIEGMECIFQLGAVSIAKQYPQLNSVFGDEEYYFFLANDASSTSISGRVVVQMT